MTAGVIVGHTMCTALAVIGGRMLAAKISVRTGNVKNVQVRNKVIFCTNMVFCKHQLLLSVQYCSSFLVYITASMHITDNWRETSAYINDQAYHARFYIFSPTRA